MKNRIDRVLTILQKTGEALSVLCLLIMFMSLILQVFFRYILNNPLTWTDEISRFFFIWMIGFTGVFVVKAHYLTFFKDEPAFTHP
jgi:TRAP-type C4-dicarboxylate transport system permease small subunit